MAKSKTKLYLQLPHEMYFSSDRSMAKDIDVTVAATFFFFRTTICITSRFLLACLTHVRSFSVLIHGQTVMLLVQVEDGDTHLCVNFKMRCAISCTVTGIARWYIELPCCGIAASFPVQPVGIPGRTRCVMSLCSLTNMHSVLLYRRVLS